MQEELLKQHPSRGREMILYGSSNVQRLKRIINCMYGNKFQKIL